MEIIIRYKGKRTYLSLGSSNAFLCELKQKIYEKTFLQPRRQVIKTGFPPKILTMTEYHEETEMCPCGCGCPYIRELSISSGEVLIVEENESESTFSSLSSAAASSFFYSLASLTSSSASASASAIQFSAAKIASFSSEIPQSLPNSQKFKKEPQPNYLAELQDKSSCDIYDAHKQKNENSSAKRCEDLEGTDAILSICTRPDNNNICRSTLGKNNCEMKHFEDNDCHVVTIDDDDKFLVAMKTKIKRERPPTISTLRGHVVGEIKRLIVPSDNSCLFSSICTLVCPFLTPQHLRFIASICIKNNPLLYDDVILEKKKEEYVSWIKHSSSWGGYVELIALGEFLDIEIVVFDISCKNSCTVYNDRVDANKNRKSRYSTINEDQKMPDQIVSLGLEDNYEGTTDGNEHFNDKVTHRRIYLVYDEIHYDIIVAVPSSHKILERKTRDRKQSEKFATNYSINDAAASMRTVNDSSVMCLSNCNRNEVVESVKLGAMNCKKNSSFSVCEDMNNELKEMVKIDKLDNPLLLFFQKIFDCDDTATEKKIRKYIDTLRGEKREKQLEISQTGSAFTLRCFFCQKLLKDHEDASKHAASTGHTSFGEIRV